MAQELYLTEAQVPRFKEGKRAGSLTVEWEERQYRRKLHPNGYLVTLATITIPSLSKVIIGASACSPEDQFYFSRIKGAAKALGRARQQATRLLNEMKCLPSLLGGPDDCVIDSVEWGDPDVFHLCSGNVAHNAEVQGLMKDLKRLGSKYKPYRAQLEALTADHRG